MFFKDIPYKEEEKKRLIDQVTEERIPHAQLFIGKEGCGNLALALAFVSYIFCENRTATDSCGQCKNCNQSHKYIHPDFHFSFPFIKHPDRDNATNTLSDDFLKEWRIALNKNPYMNISEWQKALGAGSTNPNINVKECNSIINKLAYQSYSEGPKILLMWLPEYLGKEGNKLLKMIEEPTDNTYLILVANDIERILPTIISRCQQMKFIPYKEQEIKEFLQKENGLDENIATQYARLAEGNINKANELIKGEDKNLSDTLFDWLRICYKGDGAEMSSFVDEIAAGTLESQIQFFQYSLHFFQAYLTWILSGSEVPETLTASEAAVATKMKAIIDEEKLESICQVINQLIYFIIRNGNKKINIMADTILIGDILRNRHKTSANYRIFANESVLIQ